MAWLSQERILWNDATHVLGPFCMQMALLLLLCYVTLQKKLFLEAAKMQLSNLELPTLKAIQ